MGVPGPYAQADQVQQRCPARLILEVEDGVLQGLARTQQLARGRIGGANAAALFHNQDAVRQGLNHQLIDLALDGGGHLALSRPLAFAGQPCGQVIGQPGNGKVANACQG